MALHHSLHFSVHIQYNNTTYYMKTCGVGLASAASHLSVYKCIYTVYSPCSPTCVIVTFLNIPVLTVSGKLDFSKLIRTGNLP